MGIFRCIIRQSDFLARWWLFGVVENSSACKLKARTLLANISAQETSLVPCKRGTAWLLFSNRAPVKESNIRWQKTYTMRKVRKGGALHFNLVAKKESYANNNGPVIRNRRRKGGDNASRHGTVTKNNTDACCAFPDGEKTLKSIPGIEAVKAFYPCSLLQKARWYKRTPGKTSVLSLWVSDPSISKGTLG